MVEELVYKYLEKAGLGGRGLSVHKLRHTAATLMYQHGQVDVRVLKDILGHESIETTQNYIKISTELKRKVIENVYPIKKNKDIPIWKRDENILKELLNI